MKPLPKLRGLVALLLFAAVAAMSQAQLPAACKPWGNIHPRQSDLPPATFASQVHSCDSLTLYYDSKAPDHFRRARWCAFGSVGEFRELAPGKPFHAPLPANATKDDVRGDPVDNLLLTMLYANGEGVPRNLDIARHYACQGRDWFGPEGTLNAIDGLKPGERFEECGEDGGSGRIVNFTCINFRQAQVDARLKAALAAARATLRGRQLELFAQLSAARERFRKADDAEEPNGTSGAVQSAMANELDLNREWLAEVQAVSSDRNLVAAESTSALTAADKQLNADYKESLVESCEGSGCNNREEARTAARAWLAYREAWVRFGIARWPATAPDQWRAWLTELRNLQNSGEEDQAIAAVQPPAPESR